MTSNPDDKQHVKLKGPIPSKGIEDFTFYRSPSDHWSSGDPPDVKIVVKDPKTGKKLEGRGLVCETSDGNLSITVRKSSASKSYKPQTEKKAWKKYGPYSLDSLCRWLGGLLFDEQCNPLTGEGREVDKTLKPVQGLLLIAGATKSSKSLVAQGLIHHYLEAVETSDRRLHLVTCEDPVESHYGDKTVKKKRKHWPKAISKKTLHKYIDYTARVGSGDVEAVGPHRTKKTKAKKTPLKAALRDALRQTPAVFNAGELRGKGQLNDAIEFAATGHFIVGTTHAGSLVEAVDRLLIAAKARTPARRGQVVQRVLGIVHLKRYPVESERGAIIPALWRKSGMGIASMVSEGLSSIVPGNPPTGDPSKSSYGRRWFSERLLRPEKHRDEIGKAKLFPCDPPENIKDLIQGAGLDDLKGI